MIRTGSSCLYLFLFHVALLPQVHAQVSGPTPTTDTLTLKEAILSYTRSNAAETHLYNGILYAGYDRQAKGHPFFQSDSPRLGSILYAGVFYPNVPLYYDLEKDIVVMPDKRQVVSIQLLTEKLLKFTIGTHTFVRLFNDSSFANAPDEGFYELLYEGKATAFARHKKVVKEAARAEERSSYRQYDNWWVLLNGRFHQVRKQRDMVNVLDSHDGGLKDYLRKNHISFKTDPEYALARAAEFYSQSIK